MVMEGLSHGPQFGPDYGEKHRRSFSVAARANKLRNKYGRCENILQNQQVWGRGKLIPGR